MKKIIVITTINSPTEATLKFSNLRDWQLIVAGDLKTPHKEYEKIDCIYLHPEYQEKKYKELSDILGWKTIQRRNIGFIEAYKMGADVMATVDDDNIPYENWGKNLYVGREIELDTWQPEYDIFDPLSVTNHSDLWHRGYPIENVHVKNRVKYMGKTRRTVKIQADLWDGDPDIDAICRLTKMPVVKFDVAGPYCSMRLSPFNSQNTFIARECIPHYFMYPCVGRMDDIWASYDLQKKYPESLIYNCATVYQQRNEQDLIKNLSDEVIGYRNTTEYIRENYQLPEKAKKAFALYQENF